MFARLTALVGGSGSLPFDLGERHADGDWGSWAHHAGRWKQDGSAVSVFKVSCENEQQRAIARNAVKRLRTLRHPGIVSFKEAFEVEDRMSLTVYLVTEATVPLRRCLADLALKGPELQGFLAAGLHRVASAVAFLNNEAKLAHGHVCAGAVVVTPSLDWRLGWLDFVDASPNAKDPQSPLRALSWAVPRPYQPAEIAEGDWDLVASGPTHALDAWGLGCLLQELFAKPGVGSPGPAAPLEVPEDLRRSANIPGPLQPFYQRLLASSPARRLDPAAFAGSAVLRTPLVRTLDFLENLSVKDSGEKEQFFRKLGDGLARVPKPVAEKKLLPLLGQALEYGGAPASAVGAVLAIREGLDEEARRSAAAPVLLRLLASPDRGVRRALLEGLPTFAGDFSAADIEGKLYQALEPGFSDATGYVRELTLKAMAPPIGPKLGARTLAGPLLKHLARLQVDEQPSIRANTTVLLGTLADALPPATAKKVLLNAFTRAVRDAFPPSRAAGLRAIVSTASLHSDEEAATRILPATAPLCVDPVPEVRAVAAQCLLLFAERLSKGVERANKAAERAATAVDGAPVAGASPAAPTQGGLLTSLGWAVGGLRSSASAAALPSATAEVADGPATAAAGPQAAPVSRIQGFGSGSPAPPPATAPPAGAGAPSHQASGAREAPATAPPGLPSPSDIGSADGWSDDDAPAAAPEPPAPAPRPRPAAARPPPRARTAGGHVAPPPTAPGDPLADLLGGTVAAPGAAARKPAAGLGARKVGATGAKLGAMRLNAAKKKESNFDEW